MTTPGQSWTTHNVGMKIMFGGLEITHMIPDGTLSDYPLESTAPYQLYQNRRFHSKVAVHQDLADKYSGGPHYAYTGYPQARQGGSWSNGANTALSWTDNVLYIAGRWTSYNPGILGVDFLFAACRPAGNTIYLLYERRLSPTNRQFQLYRATFQNFSGDHVNLSLDGSFSPYTVVTLTNPADSLTGFDATGKRLAVWRLNTTTLAESVDLITLDATYRNPVTTTLYSGTQEKLVQTDDWYETAFPPFFYHWEKGNTRSVTKTVGNPRLVGVQMEATRIGLLSTPITSATGSGTSFESKAGENVSPPGVKTVNNSTNIAYTFKLEALEFSGDRSTVINTGDFVYSLSDSSDYTTGPLGTNPSGVVINATFEEVFRTALGYAFSASDGFVSYVRADHTYNKTWSGNTDARSETHSWRTYVNNLLLDSRTPVTASSTGTLTTQKSDFYNYITTGTVGSDASGTTETTLNLLDTGYPLSAANTAKLAVANVFIRASSYGGTDIQFQTRFDPSNLADSVVEDMTIKLPSMANISAVSLTVPA